MAVSLHTCPLCGKQHGSSPCPTFPVPAADLKTHHAPVPAADLKTHHAPVPDSGMAAGQATQVAMSQEPLVAGTEPPPQAPPMSLDLSPGMMVGEYQVEGRIGEGGMGTVYSAVHPIIMRKVAIKVLNFSGSRAESASQRFVQEARAATLVRHRNIVDVFAFGQLRDGRSYLVMEFLEGESLQGYLERHGPLSFARALPIIDGICAGLKAAHDKHIVHRDLKPENIWICPAEEGREVDEMAVKILDFGLAKLVSGPLGSDAMLTRAGMTIGTPAFMSPEQCRGSRELDHRSDLYSLGVILYQMFTLRVPFVGESYIDVVNHHLRTEPASLKQAIGMPGELDDIIGKALAKQPEDRYQSVAELREALHGCTHIGDWAPRRTAPSTSSAQAGTLVGPPGSGSGNDEAREGDKLSEYRGGGLLIEPIHNRGALTLRFRGELGHPDAALSSFLDRVTQAVPDLVQRVILDLGQLDFAEPEGQVFLLEWVSILSNMRDEGLAPVTIRYNQSVSWQREAVSRMRDFDPALMAEAVDPAGG